MVEIIAVIAGICLAIIATFCFNVAIILEKKGLKQGFPEIYFKQNVNETIQIFKKILKNKSWITGFILSVIGWLPYMFAQAMVGVLIVSPIMSFGLIVSVVFANRTLREKISFVEFIAVVMLIVAPFLIALSDISRTRIDLYAFIPSLIVFLFVIMIIEFSCYLIAKIKKDTKYEGISLIVAESILFSIGAIFTNIFVQAFANASITILSFFILAEIFLGIFWFEYFHAWVFIGIWVVGIANLIGLVVQQKALYKSKAIVLWSIQNGITIIIPITAGLLVFNQSVVNYYLFFSAVALIFIATLVLSKFQADIQNNSKIIDNKRE